MTPDDFLTPGTAQCVPPTIRDAATGEFRKVAPYFTLDAWRGIAALWVVALHACLPYILNGHLWLLRNPIYLASIWGQLGVTMFFVISGYCIVGAAYNGIVANKPFVSFCADRFRRIYPPYFAALLGLLALAAATNWLASRQWLTGHHPFSLPAISAGRVWLSNLTLTQVPAGQHSLLVVAWSLCYEVAFYLIVAFFLGLGGLWKSAERGFRLRVLLASISLLTVGSLVWLCISPETCVFPLKLWYPFGLGALMFSCGAAETSATKAPGVRLVTAAKLSSGIALLLTALYAGLHADQIDVLQGGWGHPSTRVQASATLVFYAALCILRRYDARLARQKPVAFLAWFGTFSYSLYLLHTLLLPFVDAGCRHVGFTERWYLVAFFLQITVAVVGAWVFYVGIERRFVSKRQQARIASEEHLAAAEKHQGPELIARPKTSH